MTTKQTETTGPVTNNTVTETAIALVLMDKDVIKAGQDAIKVSMTSLDLAVHANAVQCLMHAEKHGDTSLMTRLLMDILDDKTGYRRQGLIMWVRAFSPMELNGKKITLTGMSEDGKTKRPFLIEKANATPFYSAPRFNSEIAKPVFQDTLLAKWDTLVREFEAAWSNTQTVNGKPVAIDPKKPFYDGVNSAQILEFVSKGKELRGEVKSDDTREHYLARQRLEKDAAVLGLTVKAA